MNCAGVEDMERGQAVVNPQINAAFNDSIHRGRFEYRRMLL